MRIGGDWLVALKKIEEEISQETLAKVGIGKYIGGGRANSSPIPAACEGTN